MTEVAREALESMCIQFAFTTWYQNDRPEPWDDGEEACPLCGGDGFVGWFDHPDLHGDDNAEGLEDHLVECPECAKRAAQERRLSREMGTEE